MYLGKSVGKLTAVDEKTVYARAAAIPAEAKTSRAKRSFSLPKLKLKSASLVEPTITPAELAAKEAELQHLRNENAVYRNRIHKLLATLRGKNRVIARQERELAAATQSEPLTVDQILGSAHVSS